MKNKLFYGIAAFGFSLALAGCEGWLESEPNYLLTNEVTMEDVDGVRAVMVGVYDLLQSTGYYGRDFIVSPELLADNCRITDNNSNRFIGQSLNQVGSHNAIWATAYNGINRVNNVLAFVDDAAGGSQTEKDELKGQAFFVRALLYHDLARSYSREPNHLVNGFDLCVPLLLVPFPGITSPDAFPSRATVAVVYEQIEKDLTQAIDLLASSSFDPNYGNILAAKSLLARVYLYEEKWSQAAAMAEEVINDSRTPALVTGENYMTCFSATPGAESIFELRFTENESEGPNSLTSIYMQVGAGYADVCLTDDLMQKFGASFGQDTTFADARAQAFQITSKSGENVVYNTKYASYNGVYGSDNVAILRTSEVYLTSAEANLMAGNTALALQRYNALHTRAGYEAATSLAIEDVLLERRLELAFEGHRFYDLKRKGWDIPKSFKFEYLPVGLEYRDFRMVANIAPDEIELNENLDQNPGY